MLKLVYEALDRQRRPLRQYNFLVFPRSKVVFARIPGAPFRAMLPVLAEWAGVPTGSLKNAEECDQISALWNGDMEPRTARQLKRLYPDFPVIAVVQTPEERLAACYKDVVLSDDPLPAFFAEKRFSKHMSPGEFALKICTLSDLGADNRVRSQHSILSYRGRFMPDAVVPLDDLPGAWPGLRANLDLPQKMQAGPGSAQPSIPADTDSTLLTAFREPHVEQAIRRKYKLDLATFFSRQNDNRSKGARRLNASARLASSQL